MATHDEAQDAAEWLAGPLGRYLLAREQAFFDGVVADVFGYNAFQLGMPQVDLLRASRMSMRCRVGRDGAAALRADFRDLPIAGGSADLVLLPHTLEFTDYPHQILREVARVLRPEGHVIIAGFNPWSLWGARRVFGRKQRYPWSGHFINLPRMKDWLALLGLEISGGQMACYVPPCATQKWLDRCRVHGSGRRSLVADSGRGVFPAGGQARERHAPHHAEMERPAGSREEPRRSAQESGAAGGRPRCSQRREW